MRATQAVAVAPSAHYCVSIRRSPRRRCRFLTQALRVMRPPVVSGQPFIVTAVLMRSEDLRQPHDRETGTEQGERRHCCECEEKAKTDWIGPRSLNQTDDYEKTSADDQRDTTNEQHRHADPLQKRAFAARRWPPPPWHRVAVHGAWILERALLAGRPHASTASAHGSSTPFACNSTIRR